MASDNPPRSEKEEENSTRKAPVFKTKEDHKREVNRLRSIKKERKMKMTDRVDDVVPSSGAKNSLSVETVYNETDSFADSDGSEYLNALLDGDGGRGEQEKEKKPQLELELSNCGGLVVVGLLVTLVVGFFFKF